MQTPAYLSMRTAPVLPRAIVLLTGLFLLAGLTSICHANTFSMSATAQAVSGEPETSYAAHAEVGVAVQGTVTCTNPTSETLTARLIWTAFAGLYVYPNGVSALISAETHNPDYPNPTVKSIPAYQSYSPSVGAGPSYDSPANGQYSYLGWTTIYDIKTGDQGTSPNVVIQPIQVGP